MESDVGKYSSGPTTRQHVARPIAILNSGQWYFGNLGLLSDAVGLTVSYFI